MNKFLLSIILIIVTVSANAQDFERPRIPVGSINDDIKLDGSLDEHSWLDAPLLTNLKTTVPVEEGVPSSQTEVRIIAEPRNIYVGVICKDPNSSKIVSFSKLRDVELENEDHIRIILDPSLDGQSGYIFSVNPSGARYDALVSNRGESENKNWDGVWEAKTQINNEGWSVEIKIPIQSINYKKGLKEWGFNIERRIQRFQETIRWSNVKRDQWFTQTSKAGLITDLPEFSFGLGTNIRPSIVGTYTETGPASDDGITQDFDFQPSLDINQRIGPNVTASLTVNTDFAETEVDSRRTNLTRFPLFFPEKRS
ncbi:MAG: carbohydrate binding family 9 domain-containing protein, partial [Bacteroidota bacterium]